MNPLRSIITALQKADAAVTAYFERKDLPNTGALLRHAPLMVSATSLMSPVLAAAAGFPLAMTTLTFGLMSGLATGVVMTGLFVGAFYLSEKEVQKEKNTTEVRTNTAGQRVEGSTYDLNQLRQYETRIASLSAELDKQDSTAVRARLSLAFTEAATYAQRVKVLEPSPLAPDATNYVFARSTTTLVPVTQA